MDMPAVLVALITAFPNGSTSDVFLSGYLEYRMKTLFTDRGAMRTITSTPEDDSRMESVAEILFKTMVKLRLEGNGGEHNEQGV